MKVGYPFYGRVYHLLMRVFKTDIILGDDLPKGRRRMGAFYLVILHQFLAVYVLVAALPPVAWLSRPALLMAILVPLMIFNLLCLPGGRPISDRRLDRIYGSLFVATYLGLGVAFFRAGQL